MDSFGPLMSSKLPKWFCSEMNGQLDTLNKFLNSYRVVECVWHSKIDKGQKTVAPNNGSAIWYVDFVYYGVLCEHRRGINANSQEHEEESLVVHHGECEIMNGCHP